MDLIRRFDRPDLRRPRAIVALEGWGDACDAASGAAEYILGQVEVEPFAVIDPEEFYDFQVRRPIVEVDEEGIRSLSWPATRFFAVHQPGEDHDLVVVLGEEPNMRWRTFARTLVQVLDEAGVEKLTTLGAFVGQVAHTLPVPIIGVGTDPDEISRHDLITSRYEGPTAAISVILEASRESGMPAISLWAATPHYLAANSNPKAMLALLRKASAVLDMEFDTAELETIVAEFEDKVDKATDSSSDLADYVRRLESAGSEGLSGTDEDDPAQLIEDIEQFLRQQPEGS